MFVTNLGASPTSPNVGIQNQVSQYCTNLATLFSLVKDSQQKGLTQEEVVGLIQQNSGIPQDIKDQAPIWVKQVYQLPHNPVEVQAMVYGACMRQITGVRHDA